MAGLPLSRAASTMTPYQSARSLRKGEGWVYLDANECPFPCPAVQAELENLNRYPDPTADRLREEIAGHYRVAPQEVIVSSGIDELIELSARTFVRPGRSVISPDPSYGMYAVAARAAGVPWDPMPLTRNFDLDPDRLTAGGTADLLFLCSPNNPTGGVVSPSSQRAVVGRFAGVVAMDEAYGEFADAQGLPSAVEMVREGAPNLLVMRTFSKAFAGAGLRLGYGIASEALIRQLARLKPPYNVSSPAQRLGLELWQQHHRMAANVKSLIEQRELTASRCRELGCQVEPSRANFYLISPPVPSETLYRRLWQEHRIMVRRFEHPRLKDRLRISVGTAEENDIFISALGRLL